MRNSFLLICCTLFSTFLFSQNNKNALKEIDSISQKRWNAAALDLDSLADPKLIGFDIRRKDTVVIRDKALLTNVSGDVPVTPYNMLRTKDPMRWFYFGENNVVFNQSSFSNWNSGGNNNIGIIGKSRFNLIYKKDRHFMDANLRLGYGFVTSQGEPSRKTEDYINITANYGYDIGKNFYLSTGFQFISQFAPGYNYSETTDPVFSDRISRFMAPGYLNAGLGVSYNPNENFQIIMRPLNGKFTFVLDPHLQKAGKYGLETDGQSFRAELGALLNVLYRIQFYKNINLVNQINFFSNYAFHIERIDVAYNGTLNMKVNQFINATVSLDLLYDHDQLQKLQMKQTLGIGFSYNFGFENKEKDPKVIKPFIIDTLNPKLQ